RQVGGPRDGPGYRLNGSARVHLDEETARGVVPLQRLCCGMEDLQAPPDIFRGIIAAAQEGTRILVGRRTARDRGGNGASSPAMNCTARPSWSASAAGELSSSGSMRTAWS